MRPLESVDSVELRRDVDPSLESALGVGQAIASAQVTPAAEAFHDENLEMLPSEVARLAEYIGDADEEEEIEERD